MSCDHSNYDEYFESCSDCKMTREQIIAEKAERLIDCMTLPAIIDHRDIWASAPDGDMKDFQLAIADYAIQNYHGSR